MNLYSIIIKIDLTDDDKVYASCPEIGLEGKFDSFKDMNKQLEEITGRVIYTNSVSCSDNSVFAGGMIGNVREKCTIGGINRHESLKIFFFYPFRTYSDYINDNFDKENTPKEVLDLLGEIPNERKYSEKAERLWIEENDPGIIKKYFYRYKNIYNLDLFCAASHLLWALGYSYEYLSQKDKLFKQWLISYSLSKGPQKEVSQAVIAREIFSFLIFLIACWDRLNAMKNLMKKDCKDIQNTDEECQENFSTCKDLRDSYVHGGKLWFRFEDRRFECFYQKRGCEETKNLRDENILKYIRNSYEFLIQSYDKLYGAWL